MSSLAKVGNNVMMNMNNITGQKTRQPTMNSTGIPRPSNLLPPSGIIELRNKIPKDEVLTIEPTFKPQVTYTYIDNGKYPNFHEELEKLKKMRAGKRRVGRR